jgi:triphosphoribosyl-dephospho-CoA synthase
MTSAIQPTQPEKTAAFKAAFLNPEIIADLASEALTCEVMLTPKPGLVDQRNNGSHRDMSLATFEASILALGNSFEAFVHCGLQHAGRPASDMLPLLRPIGIAAEQAMFAATGGVNTHKGGIFSLGLLCTAAGRLLTGQRSLSAGLLCREVAHMCKGLVEAELGGSKTPTTAGEKLYQRYGMSGARGEAASGFATVMRRVLPGYQALLEQGQDDETALLQALLCLMADNVDTNVVSRGGLEGLGLVQRSAHALLRDGGVLHPDGRERLMELDDLLIEHNLSPGGSADLLAVTRFLASF